MVMILILIIIFFAVYRVDKNADGRITEAEVKEVI